jgi:hypothetical protein
MLVRRDMVRPGQVFKTVPDGPDNLAIDGRQAADMFDAEYTELLYHVYTSDGTVSWCHSTAMVLVSDA